MSLQSYESSDRITLKIDVIEMLQVMEWKAAVQGLGMSSMHLKNISSYLTFNRLIEVHIAD